MARRRLRCAAGSCPVSLLTGLDAFYLDHRRCGELDGDVEGVTIWLACECGARMVRRADNAGRAGKSHGEGQ